MKLDESELSMAKMLIENMTKPFHAEEFRDEYQARQRDAIMQKIQGQAVIFIRFNEQEQMPIGDTR